MKYMQSIWIIGILLCGSFAYGQGQDQDTVRIIQLDSFETSQAEHLAGAVELAQAELDQAKADYESFRKKIENKYVIVEQSDPDHGGNSIGRKDESAYGISTAPLSFVCLHSSCTEPTKAERDKAEAERKKYDAEHPFLYYRKGFENGFKFSYDYRFIVPAPPTSGTATTTPYINCPMALTNAVGE